MKKVKNQIIYLLLAVLMFWSCNSKNEKIQPDEWTFGQDVYVAGYENKTQENSIARLWKNGKVQHLESGQDNILNSSGDYELHSSKAFSVFISDNDVYVAGYEKFVKEFPHPNGAHWEYISKARLWKNGIMQDLANDDVIDYAVSVFVSDGDVYVLGYQAHEYPGVIYLKLWKNGVPEIFAEVRSDFQPRALFVSDGDVYVAGYGEFYSFGEGLNIKAKLWKNGIEEELEIGKKSYAYSVFVSDGDVYVGGSNNKEAALWKNGRLETIANGEYFSEVRWVYISGDDIYLAGHIDLNARLWKNGIEQNLLDAKNATLFYSVFKIDEDVFLAGYESIVNDLGDGLAFVYSKAYLYKNGRKLNLDLGHSIGSEAYSIFVK